MSEEITKVSAVQTVKKPWLSKTVWINLALALSAFYPPIGDWMTGHGELVGVAFAALNVVLRALTKDKLSIGD